MTRLAFRVAAVAAVITLVAAAVAAAVAREGAGPPPPESAPASIPSEVRRDLEAALKEKIAKLLEQKTPEGASFKRGSYSKSFRKVEEATYRTGFTVDTAEGDTLLTERFVVTLKKEPGSKRWTVASEELQDAYRGLRRPMPGDEEFQRFDAFSFEREGLRLRAGPGALYRDFREGKVFAVVLAAEDLSYAYEPPLERHRALYAKLRKNHAEKVAFTPERATFYCDPASCEELAASAFSGLRAATKDEAGFVLSEAYRKFLEEQEERRKEDGLSGFARPWEPDRRYLSAALKKKGADDWIGIEHDSYEPLEVTFWVSGMGAVYTYPSEATRAARISPHDLERRDDASARDYEVESLRGTVELGFGDGELLAADVAFGLKVKRDLDQLRFSVARLRPIGRPEKEIKDPRMTINGIQDGEGRELTWVRTSPYSGLVVLPGGAPAGSRLEVRMQFESRDTIYKLTPTFSYVARGGWLPFVRFGDMIPEFDLTVKVPSRFQTLGIGGKVSEEMKDGVLTTRWTAASPVVFPTVIYGDYHHARSRVKASRADGSEIPVEVHVDKVGMGMWEIAPKSLPALADDAANALRLYREVFGVDYPYAKLDLVNDPGGGLYGQAPSSIVYLGSAGFWSQGILGTIGGADWTKFVTSLVAHEVGHQWWGSLVANANDRNYWFVESLAEYASSLFVEAMHGRKAYLQHVKDWRKLVVETDIQASVQDAPVVWSGDGFGGYYAAVYAKGPYAFHIMRTTWGDEKFLPFLKALAADLRGKEIVTRDIEKVAERSFGQPMEWFFDQWIRGVGIPRYTFEHQVTPAEDGTFVVDGKVDQAVLLGYRKDLLEGTYFEALVPITVEGKSGKEYQKKLVVRGPTTPFRFKVPERPKSVVLNKYGEVLAHDVQEAGT